MFDAISATHVAMIQDQLRLQSINQNISNMQTPGYKRQIIESTGFDEQLQTEMASISQQMQVSQLQIQGTVIQSHQPNDIAIAGDGFFEVQTPEGIFYTRRGDFHVNEHGELSTATGGLLLGKGGTIRVDDNQFTLDKQGVLYIENRKVDQLNIVHFAHSQQLQYRGQGLYESLEPAIPVNSTTRTLQGFIEQSNVKSIDEMMELIKTSRHFEAAQRVMRIADRLLSTAINQLGEGNV